jgi:predicted O-methyltransferase YrrM
MDRADTLIELHKEAKISDITEGGCCREEIDYFLMFLDEHSDVKIIFEIGFNAGLSSAAFLSAREDVQVVSVDLGEHPYVLDAKRWIDATYPGRHTLIIGDSTVTVPTLMKRFPNFSPDLIFIDGGHDAPIPEKDLKNCLTLGRADTWYIFDDVVPWMTGILKPLHAAEASGKIEKVDYRRADIHGWMVFKKTS